MVSESYLMVDAIAQNKNLFSRMDARAKVVVCSLLMGAVIGLPGLKLQLGIFAAALAAMVFIKIPARLILIRIVPPLVLGLIVICLMSFFRGGQQSLTIHITALKASGIAQDLYAGTTLLVRIAASVSLLLFLSVTTPVQELGRALFRLRVPRVMVEILLLTYRYIFVLLDEGTRIKDAQTMRLGYPPKRSLSGWNRAVRSTATLMGMVFIRAYDRAESTFSAMLARAYKGSTAVFWEE